MRKNFNIINIFLVLVIFLASCNLPSDQDVQNIELTSAAQTVEALLSATPLSNSTPSITPTLGPSSTPFPTLAVNTNTPAATATSNCNVAQFLTDVTIPDGTFISFGASIDKQWLVNNNGTCDWDSTYRLKWIGGDPLGAAQEQILYPARAGTQVTLRIVFTAPTAEGTFESAWQAYGPDGSAFGDPIFMKIVVSQ